MAIFRVIALSCLIVFVRSTCNYIEATKNWATVEDETATLTIIDGAIMPTGVCIPYDAIGHSQEIFFVYYGVTLFT